MNIKHILVPTDFSPFSDLALQIASSLQEKFNARVTVLHVLTPLEAETLTAQPGNPWENVVLQIQNTMIKEVEKNAPSLPRESVNLEVVVGDPAEEIARFAEENGADLIVMGTHGRTGLAGILLGSVTVGVIRKTCIPVMVVKCPEN
ncbi:universal stress protein [Candidatus Caldatribacterium saccharofermentans]|uniref:Universal stress protein n=1 Tax=Candidatus Caldatribacterium saccharofermentans TaxID=1454753 RepID=A0A7V4WJF4_9BACT